MPEPFYKLSTQEALNKLNSNLREGLSLEQVKERKEKCGLNKLPQKKALSGPKIILDQIKSPMIYILLIAGAVALFFSRLHRYYRYLWSWP